jgi:small subunit ribosomal protein S8
MLLDMLAQIKNAQKVKKSTVIIKYSKICFEVLHVLWNEGFIIGFQIFFTSQKYLRVFLKYRSNGTTGIKLLLNLTTPKSYFYFTVKQLWKLKITPYILILTTTKGILTDKQCKNFNLGGKPILLIN